MITLRNELAQRIRQLLQRAYTPIVSTWTSSVVNAGNGVYTTRPVATGEVRIFYLWRTLNSLLHLLHDYERLNFFCMLLVVSYSVYCNRPSNRLLGY
jgi:hypothetical protein